MIRTFNLPEEAPTSIKKREMLRFEALKQVESVLAGEGNSSATNGGSLTKQKKDGKQLKKPVIYVKLKCHFP